MELMQLRYFQVVATNQHITRSAEQLSVSQPAISTVIARLEHELGVPLFDRTGRSIVLNEYGKVFLRRVNRILLDIDNSKKELKDMLQEGLHTISVSVTDSQYLQGIQTFISDHSDVMWHQNVCRPEESARLLDSGKADIAVTSTSTVFDNLVTEVLFKDQFIVAVHPDHDFAQKKEISLHELRDEKLIVLQKGFLERSLMDQMFEEASLRPNIVMEGNIQLRKDMLSLNTGIAITTEFARCSGLLGEKVKYLPIKDGKKYDIILAYAKGKYLPKLTMDFCEFIKEYFAGLNCGR